MKAGVLEIAIVAEIAKLQDDMRKVEKSIHGVERATKPANDNFVRMGQSGKLAGHHMLNLSHQINDVVVSLASGQKPMTVFMQQGAQIGGIMGQAGIGVGGLARALLGMAAAATVAVATNPLLLATAAAVGTVVGAFKLFQSEVAKSGEIEKFANSLGLTKKEMKELENVHVTAGDVIKGTWKAITDNFPVLVSGWNTVVDVVVKGFKIWIDYQKNFAAIVIGVFTGAYDGIKNIWQNFPAIMGEAATIAANAHIVAVEWLANKVIDTVNWLARGVNSVLSALGLEKTIGTLSQLQNIKLDRLEDRFAGAGASAIEAFASGFKRGQGGALNAIDGFLGDIGRNSIQATKDRLRGQADDIIGDRTDKAAKKAKKEVDEFLEGLDKARIEIDNFFRENDPVKKLTEEWAKNSPAAIIINEIDRIREKEAEWKEDLDKAKLQKAIEEADRYADSLNRIVDALGALGKVGGAIGGLLGFFSGQTGSIGGPLGALLNMGLLDPVTGKVMTQKDPVTGKDIALTLGDELRDIFGEKFGTKMLDVLQGAGTGMIAGQAFLGNQSKTGQLGSALGGALGKVAGKEIGEALGGLAGKLGGPLGSIVGGVLGGVLGGMLSKTPWGRVTLSSQGASNPEGNSGASRRAAVKAGGSFDTALQEIADAFGGGIGDFGNITLGVRHGDWRVNAAGTSLKKKKGATDFDGDAEGAIAFAIQIAIERGAITGIRESTQRLLKSSDDLKRNLDRALSFEGVFKELASIKDPLGFAVDELTREFDRLRDIFDEAGASAAEYAQLEELLAHKRADILAEQGRKAVQDLSDRNSLEVELLRLLGKEEDALALARLAELAGLEASLQPLQAMVYQLQDARAIMDQFGPLADDLKAFRNELLGGSDTRNSFAFVERQFRETAAMARDGDATAIGSLRGTATAFLDAAKDNARSELEYRMAVGEVLASVEQGIFAADSQIEYAQLQIDAINNTADILQSVKDELATYRGQFVAHSNIVERALRRLEGEGMLIRTDDDTPIQVQTV